MEPYRQVGRRVPPEVVIIAQRLGGLAADVGLEEYELELLLHLRPGALSRLCNGQGCAPDERRERRLRHLLDVIAILITLENGPTGVRQWLRGSNHRFRPRPLIHLLESPEALAAMHRCLVERCRILDPGSGR